MRDRGKSGYTDPGFDRIALLQRQLLETRDKIRYLEFQQKESGDDHEQELLELRSHETLILDKIADAKREVVDKEIDDTVSVGYICNQCRKEICVTETIYHWLGLDDLNYDLCGVCYQSVGDENKKLYWSTNVDPFSLCRKVMRTKSVCEALVKAAEVFAEWPCLGYRVVNNDGEAEETFTWISHKRINQIALFLGAGIQEYFCHETDRPSKVFVGISGINSLDWIISDFAVTLRSMVVVPIHTSLDQEGIAHVINTSGISCILCSPEMFLKFTSSKKDCPTLKLVVQFNSWPYNPSEEGRIEMDDLSSFFQLLYNCKKLTKRDTDVTQDQGKFRKEVITFIEKIVKDPKLQSKLVTLFKHHINLSPANLLLHSKTSPDDSQSLITVHVTTMLVMSCVYHCFVMGCLPQPVTGKPDDLVSVIYTSGSTGFAKGVTFTNRTCLQLTLGFQLDSDVIVCKDSLAHASERETVFSTVIQAGRVGIMTNLTLLMDDIGLLQPTILSTTPRFYSRLYSEYQQLLELMRLQLDASSPNYDALLEQERKDILSSLRLAFSNRLKKVIVGGAATSREVLEFMRELFNNSYVSEGYGCTEVGNIASMNTKSVASLHSGVEFQLSSVPALDYHVQDPSSPQIGDKGELLVRTGTMTGGYHNNLTKSASAFADGWFHTGDIIEIVGDRSFKIIDRLKNFFKLSQGEFVCAEQLENIYLSSVFVDQVYITCADTNKYQQRAVFAVVVPHMKYLRESIITEGIGVSSLDDSALCSSKAAINVVHQDLVRVGMEKKLRGFEVPHSVLLDSEPFTVQNGCLTSSEKIARIALQKRYQDRVNQCVAELPAQDSSYVSPAIPTVIAQMLGLKVDLTSATLSDKSFSQHGGDSLTAMRFTAVVKDLFNVDVNVDTLLSSKVSLDQLTNIIGGHTSSVVGDDQNVLELMRQDMDIEFPTFDIDSKLSSDVSNVFLTGATGFLGCFLLYHLLIDPTTSGVIYCLVRCKQESEGMTRLKKCFEEYNLPPDQLDNNVKIVSGDLEEEWFGIDQKDFCSLADSVSCIYHVGARVHHILGYGALRKSNVIGTVNVLKLAEIHCRPVYYVSSTNVADYTGNGQFPIPEVPCEAASLPHLIKAGGYAQTKWVSEYLVWQAGLCGLPIVIYRPGMISWSISTGMGNKVENIYFTPWEFISLKIQTHYFTPWLRKNMLLLHSLLQLHMRVYCRRI
ncbi:carboxylic acid reductase-like isoform X2 [Dysidea avara]|uniref:carboxylic acid reductase-like isoform X2 n=1 Tax=Dysidea avara TaxID=196820 RepID=UPI00332D731C